MSGLPDSASRTIRAFLGCATVAFLEGYDIQSIGVAAPRVAQAFDLARLGDRRNVRHDGRRDRPA